MATGSIVLLLGLILGYASATPKSEAALQVLDIVKDSKVYDKDVAPSPVKSGPLEVTVNMLIRSLDIDDVNMRANVDLTFRMMWEDQRISYSVAGVPNVGFTDYTKFWIPDPFFKSSVSTKQLKTVHTEAFLRFTNKGKALFSTRFLLSLNCHMDLSRFPHDRQTCPIAIASYGSSEKDIVFNFADEKAVEVVSNIPIMSDRFTLEKTEMIKCDSKTVTGVYSCLSVLLTIKRDFSTYLLEWYLPCMSLVILAFLSQFVSAEALLPRLVMTVGPLLTLTAASVSYSKSLASVPYSTALDLFTGISLLSIFLTILHVIVAYYYSINKPEEVNKSADVESNTTNSKWKNLLTKLKEKADYLTRVVIIGFYGLFVFLYFLAYSF